MKKILFGLGIAVSIAAVIYSAKVKTKFEDAIAHRKTTEGEIVKTDALVAKTETERMERVKELEAARDKVSQAQTSLETERTKGTTLKTNVTAANKELDTQKETLVKLEEVRKRIEAIINQAGVKLEEIPQHITKVEEDLKAREKKAQELSVLVEGATKSRETKRDEVSRLADRKAARDSDIRHNARESVVTAVNNDWGFVLVGAGSNQGFTPQAELLVKRDGLLIGKVKPSSVEANQTIAEINYSSLHQGARIQPGDIVILAQPTN